MMPRALLGGTFDPVHYGHLSIADRLRRALRIPLALLPTAVPPHKSALRMTSIVHRLEMVRLALAEFDELTLCELELGQDVCYTIETLRQIRAQRDGAPVFVVGMDAVVDLPTWRDYLSLIDEFDLVAVARPGHATNSLDLAPEVRRRMLPSTDLDAAWRLAAERELGRGGRIFPIEITPVAISSREIRRRAASETDLGGLVPRDVALYIRRHRLYREGVEP